MKTPVLSLLFILLIAPFFVSAHDLLPRDLYTYIQNNPNATAEDLRRYADEQHADLNVSFHTSDALIAAIKSGRVGFWHNALDFLKLGIEHILTGPDHILFVISMLLVFASIPEILSLTSTFTVAHSVLIVLAGTALLSLSARIVEPMIALSITYVALTSVFLRSYDFFRARWSKVVAVFFFGIFHGLGFAGALKDIRVPADRFLSSLAFFNLGIEAGQLIIIFSLLPLLLFLRRTRFHWPVIQASAAVIAAAGLFWGVSRIIG